MAVSTIKQAQALKTYSAQARFTFTNSQNSATVSPESISGNVVTKSNLKNILINGNGVAFVAGQDTSGNIFACYPLRTLNTYYDCEVLLFYI